MVTQNVSQNAIPIINIAENTNRRQTVPQQVGGL
jgi:hypothetical protein